MKKLVILNILLVVVKYLVAIFMLCSPQIQVPDICTTTNPQPFPASPDAAFSCASEQGIAVVVLHCYGRPIPLRISVVSVPSFKSSVSSMLPSLFTDRVHQEEDFDKARAKHRMRNVIMHNIKQS